MFKLRYNALSFVQIFFGFLNSVLLLKIFGVSGQTDAYFIGDIIMGGVVMLQMMAVEQFLYFYNELKAVDRKNAGALYSYSLFLTLVIGGTVLVLLNVLSGPVIRLFAYKLDPARLELLKSLFPLFSLLAVVNPLNFLNAKLLNAEGRFAYPYALGIIPSLFSTAGLALIYAFGCVEIVWLLAASVAGGVISAVLGLAAVKSCGISLRPVSSHPAARSFVSNSIKIRFGQNITSVLAPLITNNVLAAFSAGAVSYYGYAWKIVTVVGNLSAGPSAKMFATAVASAWPLGDAAKLRSLIRQFLSLIIPLFSVSVIAAYAALPSALRLLSSVRLAPEDIHTIRVMFLALSGWYLIGLAESAFLQVCLASKNSAIFIKNNAVFISVYFAAALFARDLFGIYVIPAALMAAQGASFFLYSRACSEILRGISPGDGFTSGRQS